MLASKLFRSSKALQDCAIKDSAHIVPGSRGDAVELIQTALIVVENHLIDKVELREKRYGPSTAQAVLSYKTKRRIINFTYQKQADNIVGKMTITALDAEMTIRENTSRIVSFANARDIAVI